MKYECMQYEVREHRFVQEVGCMEIRIWAYGSMECGSMAVCIGLWVNGSEGVWKYGCMGVWLQVQEYISSSRQHLCDMDEKKAPQDKLLCISQCCQDLLGMYVCNVLYIRPQRWLITCVYICICPRVHVFGLHVVVEE